MTLEFALSNGIITEEDVERGYIQPGCCFEGPGCKMSIEKFLSWNELCHLQG